MRHNFMIMAALMVVLLSVSCKKLPETVKNSIGKSMQETGRNLEDMGFKFDRVDQNGCLIYEHGDTLVTVSPSILSKDTVAGIFLTINKFDPQEAIDLYKDLRKYCADTYPFYGCKIIDHNRGVIVDSTHPETIDTISADYLKSNMINLNERWHSEELYNNRNSIAIIRHDRMDNMWQVNLIFRTSMAYDF